VIEPTSGETPTDRFDRWAPWYDRSALQRLLYGPTQEAVLQRARRDARDPHRILDIGCGTGRLVGRSAQCFPAAMVVGVDSSAAMTDRARATAALTSVEVVQARAERLPFADAVFDLIMVTLSLRHWRDLSAGLAEIRRVMGGKGRLVLADVFDTPPRGRRLRLPPLHRGVGPHVPEQLRSAIVSARLTCAGTEPAPLPGPLPPATIVSARHRQGDPRPPAVSGW
jgi:ubiquinone/menaquinone biosynthesis C-methylase UbiE